MLNIIKNQLLKIISDIDAGSCNLSLDEEIEVINFINKLSNKECRMSKYEAYSYLNISRAKFDNLVKEGKLPTGKKQQGFKELSWTKGDLDKYVKQLNIN